MERSDIERLVRLSDIYKRIGNVSLGRMVERQLEAERDRRAHAGLDDLVTTVREERA